MSGSNKGRSGRLKDAYLFLALPVAPVPRIINFCLQQFLYIKASLIFLQDIVVPLQEE